MLIFEKSILCFLGAAAWQDRKTHQISIWMLVLAGSVGILGRLLLQETAQELWEWGLALLPGGLLLLAGVLSGWQVGAGDGAVMLIAGIWLGFRKSVGILLLAVFLCFGVCAVLLAGKRVGRKTEIPFIPFLFVGSLLYEMVELFS